MDRVFSLNETYVNIYPSLPPRPTPPHLPALPNSTREKMTHKELLEAVLVFS